MSKAYCFYTPHFGAFWQRGANAIRVRRFLTKAGIKCPYRRERAARAGTRTTRWDKAFEDIIAEGGA